MTTKKYDALAAIQPHKRQDVPSTAGLLSAERPPTNDCVTGAIDSSGQRQVTMPIDVDPDLHRAVKSAARKQKIKMNNLVSVAIAKISTELTNIPPDEYAAFFIGLQLPPSRPGIKSSLLMPETAADTARDIAVRGGIKVKTVITAAFLVASGKSRIN